MKGPDAPGCSDVQSSSYWCAALGGSPGEPSEFQSVKHSMELAAGTTHQQQLAVGWRVGVGRCYWMCLDHACCTKGEVMTHIHAMRPICTFSWRRPLAGCVLCCTFLALPQLSVGASACTITMYNPKVLNERVPGLRCLLNFFVDHSLDSCLLCALGVRRRSLWRRMHAGHDESWCTMR